MSHCGCSYSIPSSDLCLRKLSEGVIDVAKHLGNLKFRVWQKMADVTQYSKCSSFIYHHPFERICYSVFCFSFIRYVQYFGQPVIVLKCAIEIK